MRRTPTGQRPQLNQAHSSSWRWPRLVPIQEQHARASQESRLSARSSRAQSVHGKGEQTPSPTELAETSTTENPPIKDALPQVSDLGAAGSASPVGESGTMPTEKEHPNEADESVSRIDMDEILPSDYALPQSPIPSVAGHAFPVADAANEMTEGRRSTELRGDSAAVGGSIAGPMDHMHSNRSEAGSSAVGDAAEEPTEDRHSSEAEGDSPTVGGSETGPVDDRQSNQSEAGSTVVGDSGTGSRDRRHSHEAEDSANPVEGSGTEPVGRRYSSEAKGSISTSSGPDIRPSPVQDGHMLNSVTEKSIDDTPDKADQGYSARPESISNWKKAEVQSISEDEAPDAAAGTEATDVVSDEEPAPGLTPVAPVKDRVSVADDPIPYYATPKIMVHKPSKSFQSDTSGPRTIDEILARERRDVALEERLPASDLPSAPAGSPAMPQLTRLPTGAVMHKALKVKRRSLCLRKARNLAARKTILKITLGRQLAVPTKQSLRQLANGESAIAEYPMVSQMLP